MGIDYTQFIFYGYALPRENFLGKYEYEEERDDIESWLDKIIKTERINTRIGCRNQMAMGEQNKHCIWIYLKKYCYQKDVYEDPEVIELKLPNDEELAFLKSNIEQLSQKYDFFLKDAMSGWIFASEVS